MQSSGRACRFAATSAPIGALPAGSMIATNAPITAAPPPPPPYALGKLASAPKRIGSELAMGTNTRPGQARPPSSRTASSASANPCAAASARAGLRSSGSDIRAATRPAGDAPCASDTTDTTPPARCATNAASPSAAISTPRGSAGRLTLLSISSPFAPSSISR